LKTERAADDVGRSLSILTQLGRLFGERGRQGGRTVPRAFAICVASGKGGTGKSFFTSNLGVHLAAAGRRVLLLDADLGLANLHLLLGVHPRRTLADVVEGRARLGDVIETCPHGPALVPGASGVPRLAAANERDVALLADGVGEIEPHYGVLVLDSAAGLSPLAVALALASRRLVLVTNRDLTALTDAYAFLKTVHRADRALPVGVVVNRARDDEEGRRVFQRLADVAHRFLERPLDHLGTVPEDDAVPRAGLVRTPLLVHAPDSPAAAALRRIGDAIAAELPERSVVEADAFSVRLRRLLVHGVARPRLDVAGATRES
jgi:flagellar biosynthesis protein FlhG